jgi:hypothetical protein
MGHRFVCRGRQRLAGLYVESRTVPGTDDFMSLDAAAGQGFVVVGAHVFDGVEFAIDIEYGNQRVVDVHHAVVAGGEFVATGDVGPFRHGITAARAAA